MSMRESEAFESMTRNLISITFSWGANWAGMMRRKNLINQPANPATGDSDRRPWATWWRRPPGSLEACGSVRAEIFQSTSVVRMLMPSGDEKEKAKRLAQKFNMKGKPEKRRKIFAQKRSTMRATWACFFLSCWAIKASSKTTKRSHFALVKLNFIFQAEFLHENDEECALASCYGGEKVEEFKVQCCKGEPLWLDSKKGGKLSVRESNHKSLFTPLDCSVWLQSKVFPRKLIPKWLNFELELALIKFSTLTTLIMHQTSHEKAFPCYRLLPLPKKTFSHQIFMAFAISCYEISFILLLLNDKLSSLANFSCFAFLLFWGISRELGCLRKIIISSRAYFIECLPRGFEMSTSAIALKRFRIHFD